MKYKTTALFWIVLFVAVLVMIICVRKYVPPILLFYTIVIVSFLSISLFLATLILDKKYVKEQRDKKRNSALKKANHYMKLYTAGHDVITLFNRQVSLRYYINKGRIVVYGNIPSVGRDIAFEAASSLPYLADDVWDYMCFSFDRTVDIAYIYYICKTNCMNVSFTNLPQDITETAVIHEFEEECKKNSDIEFGKNDKIDFNLASEDDLISKFSLNKKIAKKIIKYKNEHGPFISFSIIGKLFKINKSLLNNLYNKAFISSVVINRHKIEQALDLV